MQGRNVMCTRERQFWESSESFQFRGHWKLWFHRHLLPFFSLCMPWNRGESIWNARHLDVQKAVHLRETIRFQDVLDHFALYGNGASYSRRWTTKLRGVWRRSCTLCPRATSRGTSTPMSCWVISKTTFCASCRSLSSARRTGRTRTTISRPVSVSRTSSLPNSWSTALPCHSESKHTRATRPSKSSSVQT